MLTTHRVRRTTIAVALAGALLAPAASADPHFLDNRRPAPDAERGRTCAPRTRATLRSAAAPGASRT